MYDHITPNNGKKVTIYDVAKAAGVSAPTVSRALSHPGRISLKTEIRIREAAARIGYNKEGLPTSEKFMESTGVVLGLVPDNTNPLYAKFLRGAQKILMENNLQLLVLDAMENPAFEEALTRKWAPKVDGILLVSSRMRETAIYKLSQVKPTVLLNRAINGVYSVSVDSSLALRTAIRLLKERGVTTLTYIAGPSSSWSSEYRRRIIAASAETLNLKLSIIKDCAPNLRGGETAFRKYVNQPTGGVLAFNDLIALGFMNTAQDSGLRIPEDVSIIGFDNIDATELMTPPLSTIDIPASLLGQHAAETLISTIHHSGETQKTKQITEQAGFVQRNSILPEPALPLSQKRIHFVSSYSKKIDLTLISSSIREAQARIDEFMRRYPNIRIHPIEGGTQTETSRHYLNRVMTQNDVPVLFNVESNKMIDFAARGALMNLSNTGIEKRWAPEFNNEAWNRAHYANSLYGLPGDQSQIVMFYRTDLFEKYNLTLPRTWEEYYEQGVNLHRANPQKYMGLLDISDSQHYLSFFRMNGAQMWHTKDSNISFDATPASGKATQTAHFIQRCIDDGVLKPVFLGKNYSYIPQIAEGNFATIVHANWFGRMLSTMYPQERGKWKVCLPPAFDLRDGLHTAEIGGSVMTISSSAPRRLQEAGLAFVHWFQASKESVDLRAPGSLSATTYFEDRRTSLDAIDPYFEQNVLEVYSESAKYLDTAWDNLPVALQLDADFRYLVLPHLVPGGNSQTTLGHWLGETANFASANGFHVDV